MVPESTHDKIIIGVVRSEQCGHCRNMSPEWSTMEGMVKTPEYIDVIEAIKIESGDTKDDQ